MKQKDKFRFIDFTHKEMIDKLDVNEKTFQNRFKRFLEMYGLDKKHFKKNLEETGNYFWAAEWAELAALLIKVLPEHPCFQENAKEESIAAQKILKYYETLLPSYGEM